jgi:hypothetical protein
MPVVFAELARQYSPGSVNDPASSIAAANGQYLLIEKETYDAIGGYRTVATSLLEDVALAREVKRAGKRIRFRYGADAVSTRMYRSLADLRAGWSKNLALLFPNPTPLAVRRAAEFAAVVGGLVLTAYGLTRRNTAFTLSGAVLASGVYANFLRRVRKAHFGWRSEVLAFFGLPVFALLLRRSDLNHRQGRVIWKGRTYTGVQRTQACSMQPQTRTGHAVFTTGETWSI